MSFALYLVFYYWLIDLFCIKHKPHLLVDSKYFIGYFNHSADCLQNAEILTPNLHYNLNLDSVGSTSLQMELLFVAVWYINAISESMKFNWQLTAWLSWPIELIAVWGMQHILHAMTYRLLLKKVQKQPFFSVACYKFHSFIQGFICVCLHCKRPFTHNAYLCLKTDAWQWNNKKNVLGPFFFF